MKQRNAATDRGTTIMGIAQKLFIRPDINMIKFSSKVYNVGRKYNHGFFVFHERSNHAWERIILLCLTVMVGAGADAAPRRSMGALL
jgi:hypothetical protein